jgi:hypothetical protein
MGLVEGREEARCEEVDQPRHAVPPRIRVSLGGGVIFLHAIGVIPTPLQGSNNDGGNQADFASESRRI